MYIASRNAPERGVLHSSELWMRRVITQPKLSTGQVRPRFHRILRNFKTDVPACTRECVCVTVLSCDCPPADAAVITTFCNIFTCKRRTKIHERCAYPHPSLCFQKPTFSLVRSFGLGFLNLPRHEARIPGSLEPCGITQPARMMLLVID